MLNRDGVLGRRRSGALALGATSMAIATAAAVIALAPAAQAQTVQNFRIAIQTSNGTLGLLEPDGTVSNVSQAITMDSEDSPAITPLSGPAFGFAWRTDSPTVTWGPIPPRRASPSRSWTP